MKETESQKRRRRLADAVGGLDHRARAHTQTQSAYSLAELQLAAIEYAAAVAGLERNQ